MLAALLCNALVTSAGGSSTTLPSPTPRSSPRHGNDGRDHDERLYWLMRRKAHELSGKRQEASRSKEAQLEQARAKEAQEAFQKAKTTLPSLTEQVVMHHMVRQPLSDRYAVDFDRLARDAVALAYLEQLRQEVDDEEAFLLLLQ